jgi:hypothetical protein
VSSTCEVRVEGVVGLAMLQHLHWSHRVVPEHTVLRVAATAADLPDLLQALTEAGLIIESVRPIDPTLVDARLTEDGGASRAPDPGPGAPRPPVG